MNAQQRHAALMTFAMALPVLQRSYRAAADKAVAHVGISQALGWPLLILGRLGDAVRPGMLANALGIEAPSLARSLDHLVDAGLAERRDDPLDRRAKTLHLTAAGRAACDKIEDALNVMRTSAFEGITDQELQVCLGVFTQLGAHLGCTLPTVPAQEAGRSAAPPVARRRR